MITLKVTPDGGESYEVTATSRDVLVWEKTTKGNKSFVDLVQSPNLVDLFKVAHIASWRQGLFTGNFQEFEATCEVEGADEEADEEPDPTQSAASAEPSSDSPSVPVSPRPSGRKRASARS
jgi:hypothetical protein